MKKFYTSILIAALCCGAVSAQQVATFEDLGISSDQYWDGSDGSAVFTSGNYSFINNFTDWGGGYTSWDGFAYSSMTSTDYASLSDQYNSCVGHGVNDSQTYAVVYYSSYMGTEPTVIEASAAPFEARGCYVTNAAYAYQSMLNGDAYSKQFGADDWFLLTATGYLSDAVTGRVDFYLAKDGDIVNTWQYMDLSSLGTVDAIHFTLSSSDTGQWGMNTPAYFCMDNFGAMNPVTGISHMEDNAEGGRACDLYGRLLSGHSSLSIRNGQVIVTK